MIGAPDHSATIVAIATAPGAGSVGIVRLSGDRAAHIAGALVPRLPEPRIALFSKIHDRQGDLLDEGVVVRFVAPASFTGEDIVELQCHGSPIMLQSLVRECIALGARQAEPGEFSQRAFLNGKIDLVQAESIADLIASSTEAAARSASRSLSGAFSRQVDALLQELIRLRVFVEAAIDFPEEEIDFIADSNVALQLDNIAQQLRKLLGSARRGRALRDGMKLVIAGAPNAGKSSLLNLLTEEDSAIVTDIPGTTRDLLHEHIQIDGMPLHIVDTAGLRTATDAVEREGIRRARAEMHSADRILLVVDSSSPAGQESAQSLYAKHKDDLPENVPLTILRNKCDLSGDVPQLTVCNNTTEIWASAKTGNGMDLLRQHLSESAGLGHAEGSDFIARERHILALEETAGHLAAGATQLRESASAELLAEDLRYAQDSIGRITGSFSSDDLLGEIFSSFCIGK
ncbi:MAG: tRNA modification GTPase [Halieaceae bacterium]